MKSLTFASLLSCASAVRSKRRVADQAFQVVTPVAEPSSGGWTDPNTYSDIFSSLLSPAGNNAAPQAASPATPAPSIGSVASNYLSNYLNPTPATPAPVANTQPAWASLINQYVNPAPATPAPVANTQPTWASLYNQYVNPAPAPATQAASQPIYGNIANHLASYVNSSPTNVQSASTALTGGLGGLVSSYGSYFGGDDEDSGEDGLVAPAEISDPNGQLSEEGYLTPSEISDEYGTPSAGENALDWLKHNAAAIGVIGVPIAYSAYVLLSGYVHITTTQWALVALSGAFVLLHLGAFGEILGDSAETAAIAAALKNPIVTFGVYIAIIYFVQL